MPQRTDATQIQDYLEAGGYATVREFETYTLCMVEGLSKAQAANRMGVSFDAVHRYLRLLRLRVRNPGARRIRRARVPKSRAA